MLAVLWYHVGLPSLGGGFSGVDIFFVISGFLITGLLLREYEQTGRIDLRHFYSRRMRRILPAVLATIAVTMVVAALTIAPLRMSSIAQDGAAAALSLGNMRFALESTDYFADVDPSPFRHLWSLGVEEQFYLVWPALVIVALGALKARWSRALTMGALAAGSFGFAVWLTDAFAPWAFYSLPSRLWELALGGLLAVAAGWFVRVPRLVLVAVGWFGVGLVLAGFLLIDLATPYPGSAALLPTLGAAALIVGGGHGGPVQALLTLAPVRFIGRISYSLYLWHWPILVLPVLASGEALPLAVRCALGAASVLVAFISWRLIEEPFRRGQFWIRRPRLVLATALTTATAVAVMAIGIGDYSLGRVAAVGVAAVGAVPSGAPAGSPAPASAAQTPVGSTPPSLDGASATPAPTATQAHSTPEPGASPSAAPTASPVALFPSAPTNPAVLPDPWPLPAGIRPALATARSDRERIIPDGCFMSLRGSKPPDCVYGDPNGAFTVALVGDSHAAHWFPAVEAVAQAHGWRLLVFTKASCVFVDLPIYSPILKRQYAECEAWRPLVVQRLIDERPDLTIVSSDRWLPTQVKGDADPTRQGEAMARLLNQIPGAIAIVGDSPASRVDVPVCLSQNLADITRCATARIEAFGRRPLVRERIAAEAAAATVIDLSDAICPGDPCQAVVGEMIVQRDDHHLTATFAASLAGLLDAALPIPH